ncbi:hypothetical protein F2P56_001676 [Juglans regia]|uniref:HIT-type domain-containing protein n=1 Tax=Juglans regia TaxID=51240 RepID=A0A833YFE1_JUGRE|nr:hypothetical protein F2P56_001676 [Juglans regia]
MRQSSAFQEGSRSIRLAACSLPNSLERVAQVETSQLLHKGNSQMGPRQCRVCNEAQSKYKCPSCLAPYCSVVCFKRHKEIPCAKPVSSEEKSTLNPESHVERPLNVEEPDDVLQKLQLEAIASSVEICDALKDENLQKIIRNIDCSPDAENHAWKIVSAKICCHLVGT